MTETTLPTTKAEGQAIIDHLTYCCYRYNRRISPDVAPERWGLLFEDWQAMEAKFQQELSR